MGDSLGRVAPARAGMALAACLSVIAPASQATFDFSYSGYVREHISVNLQDAPEPVPRRAGETLGLGSRIANSDFKEAGGQGELSMVRHTLKLDGLLNLGFAEVAGTVRVVREHRTDYERRLQDGAKANPLQVIDGTIDNGAIGLACALAECSAMTVVTAAGELLRDGDPAALAPALLTPAYGDVVIAGNDFGLHGGAFFDEYDDEELRELFVQFDIGRYAHFRLGRQQVVWGETDFFRAMDIIHGYDLRWRLFLELENEELRKPLILANVSFDIPQIDGALQLIYRPGWDAGDDIGNALPLSGGRWSPASLRGFDALALSPYDYHHNSGDENDANYGVRLAGVTKQINWSLNYYRNQSADPVVSRNPRIGGTAGIGEFEGEIGDGTRIYGEENEFGDYERLGQPAETLFPMVDTFGATFNAYIGGFWDLVLRGEVAYIPNQPYNAGKNTWIDLATFFLGYDDGDIDGIDDIPAGNMTIPGVPDSVSFGGDNPVLYDTPDRPDCWLCVYFPGMREIKEKPTLKIMLGFDKNVETTRPDRGLLGFFHTQRPAAWLFQVFDTYIANYDADDELLELPSFGAVRREHTIYVTNALLLNYNYDTINPGVAFAFDAGNLDSFVLPFVDLVYGNNWRVRAEANLFFARHTKEQLGDATDRDTRLLGSLANHDQATVRVTYQF